MPFHLDLDTGKSPDSIQHKQPILLIGSCFTEHMEKRLSDLKFNCQANPFGIVFNPLSIVAALDRILDRRLFTETDTIEHNGSWLCMESHTSLTEMTQARLLTKLNSVVEEWHHRLKEAEWLIITFGSAFYYEHVETSRVVANCHKLPAKAFTKKLAGPDAIEHAWKSLPEKLSRFNPSLKILFTISPVKHLRDGVVENNLSKAALTVALHEIIKYHPSCSYFPSYELVNDDLRDYRFYEADMAHPNAQAIDYVWQKFSGTYFSPDTLALTEKIRELVIASKHRPLHPGTKAHVDFMTTQLQKCLELKTHFPFLNLEKELQHFTS